MTSDLEFKLREDLLAEADALAVAEDPWPRFVQREGAHRRSRRVRAGVVAGLLVAAVGIQTNLIPLPGWIPGIAVASSASPLAEGPTRGSLAADRAWLDGLRGQVKDLQDPEGLWRITDRDAIHVAYASDVPGRRVALVVVPLRLGVITASELIWFIGPPGAEPEQMEQGGNQGADTAVATWMESDATDGGVAVVVGPAGSTVTISSFTGYSPKGVVEHRQLSSSTGTGVGVAAVPPARTVGGPALTARVTNGDTVIHDGEIGGGWSGDADMSASQEPTDEMLSVAVRDAQGPVIDRAVLAVFVGSALRDSRLSAQDVTIRLRWSGSINDKPAALFTIQPKGGGVIAYAMHGDDTGWRTDLRLLLPADGAAQRPIAWRMRAEGKDTRTDRVIVVTPPGTATATITVRDGAPTAVTLDASGSGTTTVAPNQPATVTALAADGTTLASTPVPAFETNMGGVPGSTMNTRIIQ
ncbi:hypothetical protein ACFFMR_02665 [Micromonospora andamanensis]|uniref:DUF4179 domain-containing protein n=1 Tax=Micromonospora andamanensis TaxID=1287068 RepID=A0ABQ4I3P3_9ACTN|nr:hypothetical protein [Micromonospora andamanensis]GIJ12502.1 hypothetical protein Van01_57160 [Micromonospora andamanensis]